MKRTLVVDDEKPISEIAKYNLVKEGYEVFTAYDGEEASEKVEEVGPDLIILDLALPKMDGLEVVREVRRIHDMSIIMVTAKDFEIDKVLGLELGADDYVTKPFSNRELIARIKVNLRWGATDAEEAKVTIQSESTIGDLTIHPDAYMVSKRSEKIELTHRELELLYYLTKHIEQATTREHLSQTVWGYDYFGDARTVDVIVRRLREEIEDSPSHLTYLVTRRGISYYLRNPERE